MLIALFPSGAGTGTIDEKTKTMLTGLLKGNGETIEQAVADEDYVTPNKLNEKQDKLTGSQGQVVGFSEDGSAIAQELPDSGDMKKSTYDSKGKSQDIFDYVDDKVASIVTTINEETPTTLTGLLKGDGTNIKAAVAGEDYLAVPTINTYTLSSSGWSPSEGVQTQTLPVQGISSDETTQVVNIVPKTSDFKAYMDAGVYASNVDDDSLTFTCSEAPQQDLTVYITIQDAISGVVS